jgi:hypothetical protein
LLYSSVILGPLFDDSIHFAGAFKLINHLCDEKAVSQFRFQKEDLQLFADLLYPLLNFPDDRLAKYRIMLFPMKLAYLFSSTAYHDQED